MHKCNKMVKIVKNGIFHILPLILQTSYTLVFSSDKTGAVERNDVNAVLYCTSTPKWWNQHLFLKLITISMNRQKLNTAKWHILFYFSFLVHICSSILVFISDCTNTLKIAWIAEKWVGHGSFHSFCAYLITFDDSTQIRW